MLYKRKRKPPGGEKKHGWLFWLLIIGIPLSAIASSSLSVERKLSDAVAGYLPLWTATTACLKISGAQDVTIESLDNFFEWGDQSVQYNHERRFTGLTPAGPSEKTRRRKPERLTVETGKLAWHQLQLGQT